MYMGAVPRGNACYHAMHALVQPWCESCTLAKAKVRASTNSRPAMQVLEGIAKRGLDKVVAEVCGITPQMTVV